MRISDGQISADGKYLFVLRSRIFAGGETYVIAENKTITAYGECPIAALAAAGRDGLEMSYGEYVERIALAADDIYEIGDGKTARPLAPRLRADRKIDARFLCGETAELASAIAGWPPPTKIFPADSE